MLMLIATNVSTVIHGKVKMVQTKRWVIKVDYW